jgi:hypothetical protein
MAVYPECLDDAWLPSAIEGTEQRVGMYVGTSDNAVAGQPSAPCLHSVHLGHTIADEGHAIALARIHLFLQQHPTPTYVVAIGRIADDCIAKVGVSQWHLPPQGMIGLPLPGPLPGWVGTTIFGRRQDGAGKDIVHDLEVLGLTAG